MATRRVGSNTAKMPRGRAPRPTAAQLRKSAEITDDDILDAAATFRRDAPAPYRDLLDATARDETLEPPTPPAS